MAAQETHSPPLAAFAGPRGIPPHCGWLGLGLALVLGIHAGCRSSTGPTPSNPWPPVDGHGDDARGDRGPAGDGDTPSGDLEWPPGAATLVIPPQTHLCSGFTEGYTWTEELPRIATLALVAGDQPLPTTPGTYDLPSFSDRLRRGNPLVGQQDIPPQSPVAQLTVASYASGPTTTVWEHAFRAPYRVDEQDSEVTLLLTLAIEGGAFPGSVTIDGDLPPGASLMIVSGSLHMGTSGDWDPRYWQYFALCDTDEPKTTLEVWVDGGDRLTIETQYGPGFVSCYATGKTGCRFLTHATAHLAGGTAVVNDRLDLVLIGSHHNWSDSFWVTLDPPIGQSAALLVEGVDTMTSGADGTVTYLNAALGTVQVRPASAAP